jgi:Carboxypeptidase regulatory-like domain
MIQPTTRRAARPRSRWMRALALLAPFVASAAGAQVRGTVLDATGAPLADAEVQVWMGTRFGGRTGTDADGGFRLRAAADSLTLTVHRIGFQTRIVQLGPADTAVVVRLAAAPLRLAPVTVTSAGGRICPNREDPAARARWTAMRARYWQPSAAPVVMFGLVETRSGVGAKEDVHDPAAGERVAGWTEDALLVAYPDLMPRSGYATRANGGAGDRTAFWSYRALDDGLMQDFTGDFFGQAHTFSVVSTGAESILVFCPRERMGRTGQMEGTLRLDAAGNLAEARWRFRTPSPDEDAGGEAAYEPPDAAFGDALLVRESRFWRRTSGGRYYFEARTFTGWRRSARPPRD